MDFKKYFLVLLLVCMNSVLANAVAMTDKERSAIEKTIEKLCLNPTARGQYWESKGDGQGKLSMVLFKLLGDAGVDGHVAFKKKEQEGVQGVLKAQQAAEHANYRDCVWKIIPFFVGESVDSRSGVASTGGGGKHIDIRGNATVNGSVMTSDTIIINK